jgi:alpha-amylase/alpha-mannosidase (GH57 family)
MPKAYLCIHGHFYQPPRENPWIEAIEPQESAYPFHDWQERVAAECYQPNAFARVLDAQERIISIVNNYAWISFNFGPTIIHWLKEKAQEVYERLQDADRESLERWGHGNAIAQCYNHVIMPLANERDKITQIVWGLQDFEFHFGRSAESIWLPETAINYDTLKVLVNFPNLKFIILSPYQAKRVSPIGKEEWISVENGHIDPGQPYRCFAGKGKYIDIFFYDGPISRAIAFEKLLSSAELFTSRLAGAINPNRNHNQLIHVATDGETYGHHSKGGEKALAFTVLETAEDHGFELTNYAGFLAYNPPTMKVELKEGPNNEGTAWSCSHGVGRWKENCGCKSGGPEEWTQEWRKPLREALDWLRDQLIVLYEKEGRGYLKDVWKARNDYIHVILDRSEASRTQFLQKHALKHDLSYEEQVKIFKLLEIQRQALLMYTSCGWFFTEISGIETVQIILYADRAIQLAEDFGLNLQEEFLERLEKAPSNLETFKNGRGIYEKLVLPCRISPEKFLTHVAIASLFKDLIPDTSNTYSYHVTMKFHKTLRGEKVSLALGRALVASVTILERKDLVFVVCHYNDQHFRCTIQEYTEGLDLERFLKELGERIETPSELRRFIDESLGRTYYTIHDMLIDDEKKQLLSYLVRKKTQDYYDAYSGIYDNDHEFMESLREVGLDLPEEYQIAAEYTLSRRLEAAIMAYIENQDEASHQKALKIIEMAGRNHYTLRTDHIREPLEKALCERISILKADPTLENLRVLKAFCDFLHRFHVKLNLALAQNLFHDFLVPRFSEEGPGPTDKKEEILRFKELLLSVANQLYFNGDSYQKILDSFRESAMR